MLWSLDTTPDNKYVQFELDLEIAKYLWMFDPALWDILTRILGALAQDLTHLPKPLPSAAKIDPPKQIKSQGLQFERFDVTTDDGYILDLWHVYKTECVDRAKYEPVFFQHGLIDIAGTWFFNSPNKSMASRLANNCRDVWLGNNRGTVNSFKHVNLTVDDQKYWDYSFHEMAKYDVPANINFILEKTGHSKINYVGHSQGTTQFWLANILHDDIGSKIKKMAACAPVMFLHHTNSEFVNLSLKYGIDKLLIDNFNEILWFKDGYNAIYTIIDSISPRFLELVPRTSWMLVQSIVGYDKDMHLDVAMMPMMGRNDVGGTSTINLKHWA